MFSDVAEIARLAQIYLLIGAEIERGNSCRRKSPSVFVSGKTRKHSSALD